MKTLLNIIWLLFGGLWLALGYIFFGVLACILIVTIPAGVASFRMASYALWPFGRSVVERSGRGAVGAVSAGVMNVIWFLIAGLWLAIGHIMTAAAVANVKMIPVTCFPFGKEIVKGYRADGYAVKI